MNKLLTSVALMALITTCVSGLAQAQTVPGGTPIIVGDPVAQISQRLQEQQKRIDSNLSSGRITTAQANRDEKTETLVANLLAKDQAKHGGTITPFEQIRLNKKLDKISHRLERQVSKVKFLVPVATPAPVLAPTP